MQVCTWLTCCAAYSSAQTPSSDPETVVLSTNSEVALASLGVTPQNIIFSTGNEGGGASRAPSRLHQTGNWQRRFSTLDSPRSTSSLDLGRPNGGRSVSGASTTDALRKRLMHGHNLSSTSLSSTSASPRRSSLATRPAYPVSPPASTSAANDTASSSGASYTAGDHLGASSATIRPPGSVAESSTTRQRSKVSAHGVGVAKVSAAVGSDMTTALGQLTSEVDNMSVSGASVQAAKEDGKRFTSTYGECGRLSIRAAGGLTWICRGRRPEHKAAPRPRLFRQLPRANAGIWPARSGASAS